MSRTLKEFLSSKNILFFVLFTTLLLSVINGFSFSSYVLYSSFAVLIISSCILLSEKRIKDKSFLFVFLPLIAVFFSYFNADFQTNIRDVSIGLINAFAAFFIMAHIDKKSGVNILLTLIFLSLWISFLLFINFFSSYDIEPALTLNINILSGFLLLVYPLVFGFVEKEKHSLFFIIAAFIIFSAIIITKSRTALTLSYLVSLFYFIRLKNHKAFRIFFIIISSVMIAGVIAAFSAKAEFRSFSERMIWWQTAFLMFKDNLLFGVGFGNYGAFFSYYRPELVLNTIFAHNTFMQILAETGLFGALCFITALFFAAKNVLLSLKNKIGEKFHMRASSVSAIVFLVFNITEYGFYIPAAMMSFFIVCGYLCSYETEERKNKKRIYLITVAAAVLIFYTGYLRISAEYFYEKGKLCFAQKDFKNAADFYLKAVKFDEKNPEYYHQAAQSLFSLYILSNRTDDSYLDEAIRLELISEKYFSHSAQIKAGLSSLYGIKGEKQKALEYAQEARKADRFNPHYLKL